MRAMTLESEELSRQCRLPSRQKTCHTILGFGPRGQSLLVSSTGQAMLCSFVQRHCQTLLDRQGHGQASFHRPVARPRFAPSSARPVVLTTKRQGQVSFQRQEARPSLALSSRGKANLVLPTKRHSARFQSLRREIWDIGSVLGGCVETKKRLDQMKSRYQVND